MWRVHVSCSRKVAHIFRFVMGKGEGVVEVPKVRWRRRPVTATSTFSIIRLN